mgnify:FL=1
MKKLMSVVLCVIMAFALAVNMFAEGVVAPTTPTWTRETTYKVDISDPAVSTQLVAAGDTFSVSFRLYSNAFVTVSDGTNEYPTNPFWDNTAKMSVTVGGAGFTLAGSLAEQQVSAGHNVISILTDKNMEEGRHQLTLTVTCTPRDGSPVTATQTFNIDVEASSVELEEDPVTPAFTMTGASIPEGKGKSNLSTKLSVSFKNTGLLDVTDVKATISGLGELVLNTYTDTVEIGDVASGDTFKATFPIKFPEYPTAQTTTVVTLKYKDGLGNEYSTDYNVFLQAKAKEKPQEVGEKTLEPKVIVSNYSVDVEKIVSGEEFTLTFVLKNTSHDKDVMNMTVDVNTSSSGSSGSGGQGSTPETVFSPIDGTTSFYTERLDKDGEIEYVIKLKTSASAGAKSYPIQIEYDFQYEANESYVSSNGNSMTINLPVTQPIKFELMEWNPPTECPIDGTAISFQYFNKSKNPMTNLAVSVEGDFTMSTQYVGTLNASSYDFFNGTIVPAEGAKVGDTKKGLLVFTFEDASSNEQRVEYPIEATITEAAGGAQGDPGMMGGDMAFDPGMVGGDMMEPGMPGGEMPVDGEGVEQGGMSPALKWGLIIGVPVVVLIVIIIIVVAVKKRKAKLLEDDDDE